jgi:hypothetical protein
MAGHKCQHFQTLDWDLINFVERYFWQEDTSPSNPTHYVQTPVVLVDESSIAPQHMSEQVITLQGSFTNSSCQMRKMLLTVFINTSKKVAAISV